MSKTRVIVLAMVLPAVAAVLLVLTLRQIEAPRYYPAQETRRYPGGLDTCTIHFSGVDTLITVIDTLRVGWLRVVIDSTHTGKTTIYYFGTSPRSQEDEQ